MGQFTGDAAPPLPRVSNCCTGAIVSFILPEVLCVILTSVCLEFCYLALSALSVYLSWVGNITCVACTQQWCAFVWHAYGLFLFIKGLVYISVVLLFLLLYCDYCHFWLHQKEKGKKKKKKRSEYTYGLTFGQLASLNVGLVKNDYVAVFFGDYEWLSNSSRWYQLLSFTCSSHIQWPWPYFKVTAASNILAEDFFFL